LLRSLACFLFFANQILFLFFGAVVGNLPSSAGGDKVYVGNEKLMRRLNLFGVSASTATTCKQWSSEGGTVGFIGVEKVGVVAAFSVADKVRATSRKTVKDLHDMGVEVYVGERASRENENEERSADLLHTRRFAPRHSLL